MAQQPARYRRWTADTEVAFLMALRLTGSVTRACAAIGRSTHGAGDRRRRLPDFAAKWQQTLDEWQAEQAAARRVAIGADQDRFMDNRTRYDGLTPLRQRALLRALTETGTYEEACKRVRLSAAGVRRMRARYPSFAAACERALSLSLATLEQAAAERAVTGVEEPVWHAGKLVGTRRRYSDALLKDLLAARRKRIAAEVAAEAVAKPKRWQRPRSMDEVRDSILEKLSNMDRYDLEQKAEDATRLLAEGKIP